MEDKNPLVLGRLVADPARPTVCFYGHYDVQVWWVGAWCVACPFPSSIDWWGAPADAPACLPPHSLLQPANEDGWIADPFTMHSEDGWLYGRGTTDNKGGYRVALGCRCLALFGVLHCSH